MKLQFLVSAVNGEARTLAERMNLQAEGIIIDQCSENRYEEFEYQGNRMRCYHFAEKGVGLSRNNALLRADGDICLFADEDIVYRDGAAEAVKQAFAEHPEADMLLFNVKVQPSRRTYWTENFHRVHRYNCGRYPAYSFGLRTQKMHGKNLTYSLLFGGGAKYANGEDSLFINDCLKAGLKVYAVPVEIGEEIPRPSTWFSGYDEKFFHDRGVLYHVLYGPLASLMGLRFLLRGRRNMFADARQGADSKGWGQGMDSAAQAAQPQMQRMSCSVQPQMQGTGCTAPGLTFAQARRLLREGIRDAKKGL